MKPAIPRRLLQLSFMLFAVHAFAAGPRWVAGSQWTNAGRAMTWYRNDVQYFVDGGPLSSATDHAAAVALVDAAAAVWNLPDLPLTLQNGGSLSEDVSGGNVYLGISGPVWPMDAGSSNYAAKQIAVVLDADGSITDTLLGVGASDPTNCRSNGVTESVDLFIQPGRIAHALLLVNGRCSGPAPAQQLQLQYQLERMFGRVLGLGWSQTNDNVFTGTPAPTYAQQMHWPIMHPIDIVCGPYTYQCVASPFTLRDDDISALRMLYGAQGQAFAMAMNYYGNLRFPGGQPMTGVNVTFTRNQVNTSQRRDGFQAVSAVSGMFIAGDRGNPVTGVSKDTTGINGSQYADGAYNVIGLPLLTDTVTQLETHMETVNPLYIGSHSVGPFRMGSPSPSGTAMQVDQGPYWPGSQAYQYITAISDAAAECNPGSDGQENRPAALPAGGVGGGRLCGVGHTSWFGWTVRAGRSATVEVTATDENGLATQSKAMPLVGVWHATDAAGTLPTVAATPSAFNASGIGVTQLRASFTADEGVRLAVTDARGDGRPDYTYRMRVLYADTVQPSRMPAGGGAIRILGTGFAAGNTVSVGGVLAVITAVTANEIDAIAPAGSQLNATGAQDVVVADPSTRGSSRISGGLVYGGAASDVLSIVTAPASSAAVGAAVLLSLQLQDAGGSPQRNSTIIVTASGGAAAVFTTCNLSHCTLVTDATGLAQTYVTATMAGSVTLQAASAGGSTAQTSFTATAVSHGISFRRPVEYIAAGNAVSYSPAVSVLSSGAGAAGQTVQWTASTSRAGLQSATAVSDANGAANVLASGALRDGEAATVQACAWTTVCATDSLVGVSAADLRVEIAAGDDQAAAASGSLGDVTLRVVDAAGHPVAGAAATVYQVVSGWQPPCPVAGRCGAAPVYGRATTTATSDEDGLFTVSPLQYGNTAAVTRIAVSVGAQGQAIVTLQKTP